MQVHEQIYTSAEKLLGKNQGDLGVVAESDGFPGRIDEELRQLCSYRLLAELSTEDPSIHPPRLILKSRGTDGSLYCISRIVFGGADHTGRTTPLAHHLVFPQQDLQPNGTAPSALLRSLDPLLVDHWQKEPEQFSPPRSLPQVLTADPEQPYPGAAWQECAEPATVAAAIGRFLQHFTGDPDRPRVPVVFVIDPDASRRIDEIIADLLALLPAGRQFDMRVQTHVVEAQDVVENCFLLFTYPNTPYLEASMARNDVRRPLILNLAANDVPSTDDLDFGAWVASAIQRSTTLQQIHSGQQLLNQLGDIEDSDGTPFLDLIQLKERLQSDNLFDDLPGLSDLMARVTAASGSARQLATEAARAAMVRHIEGNAQHSDWKSVSQIIVDERWPAAISDLCLQGVHQCQQQAYPWYFQAIDLNRASEKQLRKELLSRIQRNPELVCRMIQQAVKSNNPVYTDAVDRLFRGLLPRFSSSELQTMLQQAQAAPEPMRSSLKAAIGECVRQLTRHQHLPVEDAKSLLDSFASDNGGSKAQTLLAVAILEASAASSRKLRAEVRWLDENLSTNAPFFTTFDHSRLHPRLQRAIDEYLNPPPPVDIEIYSNVGGEDSDPDQDQAPAPDVRPPPHSYGGRKKKPPPNVPLWLKLTGWATVGGMFVTMILGILCLAFRSPMHDLIITLGPLCCAWLISGFVYLRVMQNKDVSRIGRLIWHMKVCVMLVSLMTIGAIGWTVLTNLPGK